MREVADSFIASGGKRRVRYGSFALTYCKSSHPLLLLRALTVVRLSDSRHMGDLPIRGALPRTLRSESFGRRIWQAKAARSCHAQQGKSEGEQQMSRDTRTRLEQAIGARQSWPL